ncbi:conserved Plasmodium protein, unknown function [Plasmodium knowlesi strain H]|uniref:Uncharacterized protein n=1 Tax=Plasmodium knowlesi (strain H) TaxID=5851 RepID=A0A1A7VFA1_PLAKH|nr:conserved Plasmodium protein, unknown function [Plasmodium knowlesi strain H]
MISLATDILYYTYGRNLGNFLFNTFLFFANYLNCVCLLLKKVSFPQHVCDNTVSIVLLVEGCPYLPSGNNCDLLLPPHIFSLQISCLFDRTNYRELCSLCNIKRANLNGLQMENKNLGLLSIASINNVEALNKSLLEMETQINDRLSTEFEDFYEDEYNFDFLDMVQENDLDE